METSWAFNRAGALGIPDRGTGGEFAPKKGIDDNVEALAADVVASDASALASAAVDGEVTGVWSSDGCGMDAFDDGTVVGAIAFASVCPKLSFFFDPMAEVELFAPPRLFEASKSTCDGAEANADGGGGVGGACGGGGGLTGNIDSGAAGNPGKAPCGNPPGGKGPNMPGGPNPPGPPNPAGPG